jgi:hypothetical protein
MVVMSVLTQFITLCSAYNLAEARKTSSPFPGNVHPLLLRLTVNRPFMRAFLTADPPCFALGMVEERQRQCGVLALRPDTILPQDITTAGFRFGHALLGTSAFAVLHFACAFYGFATYNVLVNPNNPLVQTVLTTMIASGDYFFFAHNAHGTATAFRSDIGQDNLAGLQTNLPRIQRSTTTATQYQRAGSAFAKPPDPPGVRLQWVCQEKIAYLDLTRDRLELPPT